MFGKLNVGIASSAILNRWEERFFIERRTADSVAPIQTMGTGIVMKLPIVAFCDGDSYVFSTTEFAEVYIEPIDVANRFWLAFDADGCRLTLTVEKQATRGIWSCFSTFEEVVRIQDSSSRVAERELVRKLIADSNDINVQRGGSTVLTHELLNMRFEQLIAYVEKECLIQ